MVAGNPEEKAREEIDRLLAAAGWSVQDYKGLNNRHVGYPESMSALGHNNDVKRFLQIS